MSEITPSPKIGPQKTVYIVLSPLVEKKPDDAIKGTKYIQSRLDEMSPGKVELIIVTNKSSLEYGLRPVLYWYNGSDTDRASYKNFGIESDNILTFISTFSSSSDLDGIVSLILVHVN